MPLSSGTPESTLCPTPAVLIAFNSSGGGACIFSAAWVGIVCSQPSVLSFSLRRSLEKGCRLPAGGSFSVNLPREETLHSPALTDLYGGENELLAGLGLRVGKGRASSAPVIEGCPIRIECRQVSSRSHFGRETIGGEVIAIQVDEEVHGLDAPVDLCRLQSFLQRAQVAGLPFARRPSDPSPTAQSSPDGQFHIRPM